VQATCAGLAIAAGGSLRDAVSALAMRGALGEVLAHPATGYALVYHVELFLLFVTLIALGPLVRPARRAAGAPPSKFGLPGLPG
jgi:BCD family chlorophyll transporter-like MFS transporter